MTKQDLKTGMLVQMQDGSIGLIVNDIVLYSRAIVDNWDWDRLSASSDTMKWSGGTEIVRVSQILKDDSLLPTYWTIERLNHNLLWTKKDGFVADKISEKPLRKEEFDIESGVWTETK